jgi:hypothetical protein
MDPIDEPAPAPPYTLTITWTVGDALVLSYPDLQPWEARAVLEEALEQTFADERADTEEEIEP